MLGTLHKMPLQLCLILKVDPTLSAVKMLPSISLVIPSKLMMMQSHCPQTVDITLLALVKVTILPV